MCIHSPITATIAYLLQMHLASDTHCWYLPDMDTLFTLLRLWLHALSCPSAWTPPYSNHPLTLCPCYHLPHGSPFPWLMHWRPGLYNYVNVLLTPVGFWSSCWAVPIWGPLFALLRHESEKIALPHGYLPHLLGLQSPWHAVYMQRHPPAPLELWYPTLGHSFAWIPLYPSWLIPVVGSCILKSTSFIWSPISLLPSQLGDVICLVQTKGFRTEFFRK